MHGLDVIHRRNEQAAARALAHADNDGDTDLMGKILLAHEGLSYTNTFVDAYARGREEG